MKNLLIITCLLVASIILSTPLFEPGYFTVHDDQQFVRLDQFNRAVGYGQFPVRWVDGLGFGFGYPLFVFYPPLVYMLGNLIHSAGFGIVDSIKIVVFLSIFLSAVSMYILSKEFWGKAGGLVSALFYIFAPYRALDIYVRGALAESFTFVWLPLVLWSFYKLYKTGKYKFVVISAIFMSLLMITHNLIFLPFMMLLPIYLVFLLTFSKNKLEFIKNGVISAVLTAGLSAFFWLPALTEKGYTIVDELLIVNLASYNMHFVYPQQLWNWPWGFGGSASGLTDGISFKVGKLHVVLAVATLLIALLSKNKKLFTFKKSLVVSVFVLFVISAFMTTQYSKPVWDLFKPLAYLQFPWRFISFIVLFSSFLAGAFIFYLRLPFVKLVAAFTLIVLLTVPNYKLFQPQTYRSSLTDTSATSPQETWNISQSSFEYLPNGVSLYINNLGANQVDITEEEMPNSKIEVLEGNAAINLTLQEPTKIYFNTKSQEATKIRANVYNFPGWQVKVDGKETAINDDNKLKLITFDIPSGFHSAVIEFKNTKQIALANLITLVTILSLFSPLVVKSNLWRKYGRS